MNDRRLVLVVAACLAGCYPSYTFDLDDACTSSALPGTSALSDAFDASALSAEWEPWGDCGAVVDGGQVLVELPPAHAYCGIRTVDLYHLTCDSVTVKVPEVTTPGSGVQTFVLVDNEDESDTLRLVYDGVFFVQRAADASTIEIESDYESGSDLWWRLREVGEEVFFDTSPDAQSWRARGHGPASMPLDAVRVRLGAGNDTPPAADPGRARFDCYNFPTGCP